MKTMTCKQMGGPCDEQIHGETPEEMTNNGTEHLKAAHPDMAAAMMAMPKDDPKMVEWFKKFQEDWDKTPEDQK
jgi:hypothetical protein